MTGRPFLFPELLTGVSERLTGTLFENVALGTLPEYLSGDRAATVVTGRKKGLSIGMGPQEEAAPGVVQRPVVAQPAPSFQSSSGAGGTPLDAVAWAVDRSLSYKKLS